MEKNSNVMGTKEKIDYLGCLKYSVGGVGFSFTNALIMSYLAFFCTDIFGVSSLVVAGLMLATKIIDAVTDPIMGLIADHTRTKSGKYRPYLMLGAPMLGLLVYLLFSSPELSASMKVVFLYVVYISYSLAFTVVGVPFIALVPVIAKGSQQRTIVVSWKNIAVQAGRTFITTFSLPLVEFFGSGTIGWAKYGAIVGILITVSFWITAWGAKPYDTVDMEVKRKKVNLLTEAHLITKNRPLLLLIIAFSTDMIANSAFLAVNMYYFKYVLERQDLVPIVALATSLTGIATNLILPALSKKIGKVRLYWWGTFFSIIPLLFLLIKPVVSINVLLISMTLFGFISVLPTALAWAMLPDCIDYAEYMTGVKGSAFISSTFSFMNKLGGAFGAFLTSFLLGIVGFAANQQQTKIVLFTIVFLRFGVPVLGYIISLISMHFYDLTEDKHAEIREVLRKRAESSAI